MKNLIIFIVIGIFIIWFLPDEWVKESLPKIITTGVLIGPPVAATIGLLGLEFQKQKDKEQREYEALLPTLANVEVIYTKSSKKLTVFGVPRFKSNYSFLYYNLILYREGCRECCYMEHCMSIKGELQLSKEKCEINEEAPWELIKSLINVTKEKPNSVEICLDLFVRPQNGKNWQQIINGKTNMRIIWD